MVGPPHVADVKRARCDVSARWWPVLRPILAAAVVAGVLQGCAAGGPAPVIERPVIDPGSAIDGVYTVRRGDTLYSIAWAFDWEFRALARANGIGPPYMIHPGQKLRVGRPPASSGDAAPSRRPAVIGKPATVRAARSTAPAASTAGPPHWRWPAAGRVVATFGGNTHGSDNKGIDIETAPGAPVLAAADGEVVYAGKGIRGVGRLIIVKHGDDLLSAYGHAGRNTASEGRRVKAGEKIAETGKTGAGAVRLHFEIRRDGQPLDPLGLLPAR